MAQSTPAARIGDPCRGCAARHATAIDPSLTERATRPSTHGIHTIVSSTERAVPPKAPLHIGLLATCPPMPPSELDLSRYATPSLPAATTSPREGSSVAFTEPMSTSPASRFAQLAGAKYDCTRRSRDSLMTALL